MIALQIASAIEESAPLDIQENWDNSGFSVGSPFREVKSAILSLDCTPEVVEEAIEGGADMIITHHPLIFKGIKQLTGRTRLEKMIERLIKNDIVVYSAHTNLDKVIYGVSGALADKIGLTDRQILAPEGNGDTGLGVSGILRNRMSAREFIPYLKEILSLKSLRCSEMQEMIVERVAVCGGSGASLAGRAKEMGAQIYITGDVSYHYFQCEKDFMIMDIGHFESENGVLDVIASILRKKIPTFAVRKSEKNNNSIYYY